MGRRELGKPCDPDHRHGGANLDLQNFQQTRHTGFTAGGEGVGLHAADRDGVRAECDGLERVRSARHPAVDDQGELSAAAFDHLAQQAQRRSRVIKLPPAMIGEIERIDAGIRRNLRVLEGLDAFQDDRHAGASTQHRQRIPVQQGLVVVPQLRIGLARRKPPMAHGALPLAVDRRIDGDDERGVAGIPGAIDHRARGIPIAADVELEPFGAGVCGGAGFERRLGHGADDGHRSEPAGGLDRGRCGIRMHGLQRGDRREQDGNPQLRSQQCRGAIDLRNIAQDARTKRPCVQRVPVASLGGLGFRAAGHIVPHLFGQGLVRAADDVGRCRERRGSGGSRHD